MYDISKQLLYTDLTTTKKKQHGATITTKKNMLAKRNEIIKQIQQTTGMGKTREFATQN